MSDQPSFMPEHRVEPPDFYEDVAAALDEARIYERAHLDGMDTSELTQEMIDYAGFGNDHSRKDLEHCIRVYRERNGLT